MKTKTFLQIILLLLALHLLYSNTVLLLELVKAQNVIEQVLRVLFGLSYSLMTVLIIAVYPRWYVYSISALLDGFAVWLKYYHFTQNETFIALASVYFGLYTAFIVVISGQIARKIERQTKKKTERLEALGFNGQSETIYKLLADYQDSLQKSLARAQGEKRTEKQQKLETLRKILQN